MDDDTGAPERLATSDTGTNADTGTRHVTRAEWNRKVREEKLRIVISQTDYDHSTAERALQHADWDCKRAIANYLRGGSAAATTTSAPRSVNQQIYSEIRKLMDTASMDYYRKKEYEKLVSQTNAGNADSDTNAGA